MIYLVLCILSSVLIFVVFKYIDRYKVPLFPAIIINYLAASLTGFFYTRQQNVPSPFTGTGWIFLALLIGTLFIIMFFLIGTSSKTVGITITSVASKMSLIIPVLFSILIDTEDHLTLLKIIASLAALSGVFLTIYQTRDSKEVNHSKPSPGDRTDNPFTEPKGAFLSVLKQQAQSRIHVLLPFLLFFGMGLVDSLVKYAQAEYVSDQSLPAFTTVLFLIAFLIGLFIELIKKKGIRHILKKNILLTGIFLGLCNYGSVYFLIRALNFRDYLSNVTDSSVIFGINNTGVVLISVLTGVLFFKEKLQPRNYAGIILSLTAIIIFAYA